MHIYIIYICLISSAEFIDLFPDNLAFDIDLQNEAVPDFDSNSFLWDLSPDEFSLNEFRDTLPSDEDNYENNKMFSSDVSLGRSNDCQNNYLGDNSGLDFLKDVNSERILDIKFEYFEDEQTSLLPKIHFEDLSKSSKGQETNYFAKGLHFNKKSKFCEAQTTDNKKCFPEIPEISKIECKTNQFNSSLTLKRKNNLILEISSGEISSKQDNKSYHLNEYPTEEPRPKNRKYTKLKNFTSKGDFEDSGCTLKFLQRFNCFLLYFEREVDTNLKWKKCQEYNSASELLYSEEFKVISGFSTDIFGDVECMHKKKLAQISTTLDFFNLIFDYKDFIECSEINILFDALGVPQNSSYDEVNLAIQNHIWDFLTSEESSGLKSIVYEFYSLTKEDLNPLLNAKFSAVNAFISFLIMVKRNFIFQSKLKAKMEQITYITEKVSIIKGEIQNNFVFFYSFLRLWLMVFNSQNLIENIFTHVKYFFEEEKYTNKKEFEYVLLIGSFNHLFFYFKYHNFKVTLSNILSEIKKTNFLKKTINNSNIKDLPAFKYLIDILPQVFMHINDTLKKIQINNTITNLIQNIIKNRKNNITPLQLQSSLFYIHTLLYFQDVEIEKYPLISLR